MAMKNSAAVRIAAPQHVPANPSRHAVTPRLVPARTKTPPPSGPRQGDRNRKRASVVRTAKIVALAICMLIMLSMLIFERASLIKLNLEKAEAEKTLRAAQSETVRLEAQFNGMVSVENVEQYAKEKLGMVKRQGRQVQFFRNQNEDEILLFNPLDE